MPYNTMQACVKVAWDWYCDHRWHHYMICSHHVLGRVTKERNADDYLEIESALLANLRVRLEVVIILWLHVTYMIVAYCLHGCSIHTEVHAVVRCLRS